ncbi:hypothetical protein OU798_05575 [Prolixibacteraceae bacterium Z1-6]|uniref:Uncharacterized protein n=1 Tax=Draconibacterium aestuarii TaxID=2998507 RepID=A0A9X3F6H5_9BACT|nr:hypothetical protein [Prolixibacteraceae bacterium Z1-6]
MTKNKLCCRIFPILNILIAAILSAGIWYFDEGVHRLTFLTDRDEFFNFVGVSLSIALLPIGIFYYLNEKEKYQAKARQLALLGFLPALLFLVFLIV